MLPLSGKPPAKPVRFAGIILHNDPVEDAKWVIGDYNPAIEAIPLTKEFSDRWAEAKLLNKYSPELAPPTFLGGDFLSKPLRGKLARMTAPERLEWVRQRIREVLGADAILKHRRGYGSHGHLPKTKKPWDVLYTRYRDNTKPRIKKLEAKILDADLLVDKLNELPDIEAVVLEQFLRNPNDIVVQRLVQNAYKEVRVHVVFGRVLNGATVSRYFNQGESLVAAEINAIESAVQNQLLDRVPERLLKLSAAMDLMLYHEGNQIEVAIKRVSRMAIVDGNFGMLDSGMYEPENDLFIANLLIERIKQEQTEYLREMREFFATPLKERPALLKKLVNSYGAWVEKNESSGFWDRIVEDYAESLMKEKPGRSRSKAFDLAVAQVYDAGLRDSWMFERMIAHAKALDPSLRVSDPRVKAMVCESLLL